MTKNYHITNALEMLKKSPLKLTGQRANMIQILFKNGPSHFTAEEIYNEAKKKKIKISLATIYNCLNQFTCYGIIKSIKVSSDKIYFDTNLMEHHHFFCEKTGKLIDIKTNEVKISRLPKLPKGKTFKSVDVVINII